MSDDDPSIETEVIQVETQAIQQIEAAAVVQQLDAAHKYPMHRTPEQQQKIIAVCAQICTEDNETAQDCHYSLPRSRKTIEGPSIHMMRVVKAKWGNLAVATRILGADGKNMNVQAVAWDMETNVRHSSEVTRPIVYGKNHRLAGQLYDEEMQKTTAMAAQSIAERNVLQATIPKSVWGPVYRAVKDRLIKDAGLKDDLGSVRKKALAWFHSQGVTEKLMCAKVGKKKVAELTREDVIALGGLKTRIEQLDTTVEEEFPEAFAEESEETVPPQEEKTIARKRPEPEKKKEEAPPKESEPNETQTRSAGDQEDDGRFTAEFEEVYSQMMDLWRSCEDSQRKAVLKQCKISRISPNLKIDRMREVIAAIEAQVAGS